MNEVSIDQLKVALERQYGSTATFVYAVPVKEIFRGKTVWEGVVHVFDLHDNAPATRAYTWSSAVEGGERQQFYAVLRLGNIRSALDAIRAAISERNNAIVAVLPGPALN